MKLGILADDLTGACDTAAQLTYHDRRVLVIKWDKAGAEGSAETLSINTQSRHITPEEASERVRLAARRLSDFGVAEFYKKIDSTLRGNWAFEVDALMRNGGFDFALIAPAFPRAGRTTMDGCQYVDGSLLERTALAHDVRSPVRDSSILNVLRRQTSLNSGLVPFASVKRGAGEIRKQMESLTGSGARLIVCDADQEMDLEQIVLAGGQMGRRILWAGSAGLARYWPRAAGCSEADRAPRPLWRGPLLIALGSLNPESRKQAFSLTREKRVRAIEIDADGDQLKFAGHIQQAVSELASGSSVIISTPEGRRERAQSLRQVFSKAVSQVCRSAPVGTLVLIGGDTAESVCEMLDLFGIEITGEVEIGIPFGSIIGGLLDGVPIVTKAGGFGKEDALLRLCELAAVEKD